MNPTEIELIYELSPMQQAMLFHSLYAPGSGVYVLQMSLRLTGRLDVPAVEQAWRYIVERHAILRTSFFWEDLEKPLQVVYRKVDFDVACLPWSDLDPAEQRARLSGWLDADRERGFDLSEAPLMRLALFELGPEVHQLVWTQHHLVVDGWSQGQLLRELFVAYAELAGGREPRMEPALSFREYISWLQQQEPGQAESFWRESLAGFHSPTLLVEADGKPAGPSFRESRREMLALPAEMTAALRETARRNRLTLNTLVQGAWALLLAQMSGREDVVFGATVSGRPPELPGVESIVGPFINTLPVRVEVRPEVRLREWLAGLQEHLAETRRYEHSALVDIQRWSELPGGVPLFDHILVFENLALPQELSHQFPGLDIEEEAASTLTNYPLNVIVVPGAELALSILYDESRFETAAVVRLLERLAHVLTVFSSDLDPALAELPVLPLAERQQLLEWNDTGAPPFYGAPSFGLCLHELFAAQAERTPEAVALVHQGAGGAGRSTYAELAERAGSLARHLRALGVGPEVRVAVCLERSPDLVASLLGVLAAGGAYVPVDPAYPAERRAFMLEDSNAAVLVTRGELAGDLPDGPWRRLDLESFKGNEGSEDNKAFLESLKPLPSFDGSLAYLIYTSGSTGHPKGVAIEHRSAAALMGWARQAFSDEELGGVLASTSVCFDLSVFEIFAPLAWGGRVILADHALALSPPLAAEVRLVNTVPSVAAELLRTGLPASVRTVCLAGEPLPAALVARLYATGTVERVLNLYGPSEDTTYSTGALVPRPGGADGEQAPAIGCPLPGTQAWVVDRHGNPVPIGVAGELWLAGAGLARGYLGRPELTAERFTPDPFGEPGGRVYRTGDRVRHRSHEALGLELEFLGRIDDQVKIRGFRIEPGEIAAALAGHPEVRECTVLARRDPPGNDLRLVAYVVGHDSRPPRAEVLRSWLQARLPQHMVPSFFVPLAALPRTPNGKLDRRALPAPERIAAEGRDSMAPAGPVEELLARIWAEVLGLERIGVHDDFFALGGHSLLATQVTSRIRGLLGAELPLRQLFETPTIAQLARAVRAQRHTQPAPPIVPVPRSRAAGASDLPLSFSQQRLWFLDQLAPGNPAYNLPWAVRLSGALDMGLLERCFDELARRHEALRTTFETREARPVQVIAEAGGARPALPRIDLSCLPDDRRAPVARHLAREEALRPFVLAEGPLSRITLVALSATEHLLLLTLHHIIADGWSMGVLVREIAALYEAFSRGEGAPLPELAVQPADFASWQRAWLQGEVLEEQLAFWRDRLSGAPRHLELPADRPRTAAARRRAGVRPVVLPDSLSREIAALSRSEGLTPFMTLLAAFATLLGRSAGQEDLLIGSPIANRNRQEIEGLIGFFVNTLVLRTELGKAPAFRDVLGQVRQTTLDAYAHQDLPFERLVEELAPDRDAHQSPLVQVLLALQNAPLAPLQLPGLELAALPPEPGVAKFDLTLTLQTVPETGGRLAGALEYDADLFDRTTMDRLLAHFAVLLAGAVQDPDREVGLLPLLTPVERQQALVEWNDREKPCPQVPMVHELVALHARRRPESVAIDGVEGRLTYGELEARANRLAHHLRRLGVGPEVLVALCTGRTPERLVGLVAVLKAGGAYVSLDPAYPRERLSFLLEETRAPVLLTQSRFLGALPESEARVICLDADWARIEGDENRAPESGAVPDNIAYVIYTSGSTGAPKGVTIPHTGLTNLVRWHQDLYQLTPEDRATQLASPAFDGSIWELWPYLAGGASVHVPDEETRLSSAGMIRWWSEQEITLAFLMTPLAEGVLEERIPESLSLKVRDLVIGGDRLHRRPAPGVGFRLMNHYGPSEYSVISTVARVSPREEGSGLPAIGRPVDNTQIYLLDRHLEPVPIGAPGELFVAGTGIARGYLRRPDLTAERFVPNPWSGRPGERMYRTGDLVRALPDGEMDFLGRLDHQVKIRGFRIELGEIESALGQHPGVRETVVLVREDRPGQKRLVAYLVPAAEAPPAEELRRFLAERLPEYMVPPAFVVLAALPLTPNGKVDRRALPEPEAGAAETDASGTPADPVEELLAGIWAEVLKHPRVGARDDFFALGGHSLLATQVISRIRGVLGVDLPLRALFEAPTVAALARVVREGRQGVTAPPIVPVPRGGDLPLSFAQQRLWLLDQLEPGNPAYNIPLAVRLSGEVAAAELARIFAEVVRRHEALRTTFAARDGKPVQVIAPELRPDVPVTDLSHLPEEEREARARELALEEARRPFDLERGPLLRLALARLGERDHLLVVTLHHIVSDGWSMGVLLREVAALSDRGAAALPELPVQYADFARWQREWMQGEVLEAELGYWRRQLAGAPRALELPTDRPRPAVQTYNGAVQPVALSPALTEAVQGLCRQQGVTPFMALLAAWAVLLGRHAGQDDVLVGSPVAGRTRREIEGLIGFFVNTVVFRTGLGEAPAFGELLERVRHVALDGYAHQDVPFERLVEELVPERDLALSPLFQAFFALQNAPVGELAVPGLSMAPVPLDGGVAKFDLSLSLGEGPAGFSGALEHNTDLFDGSTVERLWARFLALLEAAAGDPAASIADLPLLLPAEREQLLAWNETGEAPPSGLCLHELFTSQAARTPQATALVHGNERLTYAGLAGKAGGIARHLRSLGVGPEVRVAVCLERSPDLIAALLGVLAAGGAYVPVDPAYPEDRRAFMVADSDAALSLTRVKDIPPADLPAAQVNPGQLAYLIYTSGSTGRPKGVAIEHRSAVSLVGWAREEFSGEELSGVLASTSVCFDLSVFEIFVPLSCGGTVHLVDNALALASVDGGGEIRLLNTVPSAAAELLRIGALPPSVQTVCLAGEPLPGALAARLYATGTVRRVLNLYGPSEDTTYSTGALVPRDDPRAPAIGRPIRGTRAHVVDRRGALVPPGVAGELWLAGEGLARGYLGRPELTAERFTPDPWSPEAGGRVYRTGDLVRWRSGGELEFLGRIDHQVKLRGFRIELGEIEAVLRSHPVVEEAVVQVWEEAGDRRLAAWVTLDRTDPADRTDPSDLKSAFTAWLREKLPEYMVPAAFVVLDALPLSPNGKVDRRALPAPDRARRHRQGEIVAPRTRTEETVAEIWKELLGLEQVGVEDAFFELGGHSLLATQVLARVRKTFGVDLPLREIFKRPTIAGLAELIDAQAVTPTDEDELAALLAELDHLSDEEARERLEAIRLEGEG